jgi:hypothetical protein
MKMNAKQREQLRARLWAIVKRDRHALARSLRKRLSISMQEARRRARAIRKILRPRLSPASIDQITRSAYRGRQ